MKQICLDRLYLLVLAWALLSTIPARAIFLDGEGHYAIRGESRSSPGATPDGGSLQGARQSLRFQLEAKHNDDASLILEIRPFDNPRLSYLGDDSLPRECNGNNNPEQCPTTHQNTSDPGYVPYSLKATKAFLRYAFQFCLLELGRRGRDWGMGIFIDSGDRPFSSSYSLYDGGTCHVNIQKFQNLGFGFGYDKLQETGSAIRPGLNPGVTYGATNSSDDIEQIHLYVTYDDRNSQSANQSINKNIGIYFARVSSGGIGGGGSKTQLSFADLFLGLYSTKLVFQSEVLLRLGKTADPGIKSLGGALEDESGEAADNKMEAIGLAASLQWTFIGDPLKVNPETKRKLKANRHSLLFSLAFAPGDKDGYFDDDTQQTKLGSQNRDLRTKAIAFHSNFNPALIMFNADPAIDDLKVDGIFDPNRVMNAQVYSLGYRYESKRYGQFEASLIYGTLNEGPPQDVLDFHANNNKKPFGYHSSELGFELDLKYWQHLSEHVSLGAAAGALFPGDAWKVDDEEGIQNNYLLQAFFAFDF